jgi:hypothetical protein
MHGGAARRQDRRVSPSRFVLLATICAAIMCCAAAVQLLGVDRIVVTDGSIAAHADRADRGWGDRAAVGGPVAAGATPRS